MFNYDKNMTLLLVLATGSPMDVDSHLQSDAVNTDRMLDVSVSIRTISHVTIDRYGDSVWAPGSGSGLMVSAKDCEVEKRAPEVDEAPFEAADEEPERFAVPGSLTDVGGVRGTNGGEPGTSSMS